MKAMRDSMIRSDSIFINEGRSILIEEFVRDYDIYFSILFAITAGKTRRIEIESIIGKPIGGYLTQFEDDYGIIVNGGLFLKDISGRRSLKSIRMYVDFARDRLEIVDEATAEVRKVEMFIAILPCSHYTYCEAVWPQKGGSDKGMRKRHPFLWGAPCAIVPDNLKSAVTRSDRNEPVINPDFKAFAEHYGYAVAS